MNGPEPGLALGLHVTLVRTEDGGRRGPLIGRPGALWSYRPNWGLPDMAAPEQTGAPVLAFSDPVLAPGASAHAIIVTVFPDLVDRWRRSVVPGVVLPMYEGSRVCGHGTVLWRTEVALPVPRADEERFLQWLADRG